MPKELNKPAPSPEPSDAPPLGQKFLAVLLRKGTWLMFGFFKEALQGIQRVAFSQGYGLLIVDPAVQGALDSQQLVASLRNVASGLLVVAPVMEQSLLAAMAKESFPTVVMYGRSPDLSYVQVDNEGGAFVAVEHLINLGHKRIAFLNGPINAVGAQERHSGYMKAMARYGLTVPEDYILSADYEQAKAYKCMQELLARTPPPTAVFAANDYMALGAISAIQDEGLSVPGNIAVVGFDDLEMPSLTFRAPPLTTVRQPVYEIAKEGVECLIYLIEGRITGNRQRVFPSQLIVRSTCGASLKKSTGS